MNRRSFWKVIRNAVISELEYRTNYLILIFSTVITVAMDMAVYRQIYKDRDSLGGLPKSHVFSFVLVGMFIRYASQLWTLVSEAIDEIRDGSFRKYLLQPLNYTTYFYAKAIGPKITTWVLMAIALVVFRQLNGFEVLLPMTSWLPFLFALVVSVVITWQTYFCFVCLGFWVEEATFLAIAFNIGISLFSGTLMPLTWLPESIHQALLWTPFPLMGDFPVRAALELLGPGEFRLYALKAILWIGLMSVINTSLKGFGLRRYEAYGG